MVDEATGTGRERGLRVDIFLTKWSADWKSGAPSEFN